MKKLIIKSIIFLCIVICLISFILIRYGGYVDYFYEKFTSPKAHSIVLGDSRSLQGIQPSVINKYFEDSDLELPILNYSFTLKQIAYGPPYLESVKRKLDPETKNGIFIITVHPFTLSSRNHENEEEQGIFFEENMPPHNMTYVNHSPNFEYLLKNFDYFHFRGIIRKSSKTHKDGWLEETNLPSDQTILDGWKKNQIQLYQGFINNWERSSVRLESLEELTKELKNNGSVFIVRLPIDKELLDIENTYWEKFNDDMNDIANRNGINYINFNTTKNKFKTYDGIHIDKFAGVKFTELLCDSISKKLNDKEK